MKIIIPRFFIVPTVMQIAAVWLSAVCAPSILASEPAKAAKPNVLLILVDELGMPTDVKLFSEYTRDQG
jgi:hypothetical protein